MKEENTYPTEHSDLNLIEDFDPLEDLDPEEIEELIESGNYPGTLKTDESATIKMSTGIDNRPAKERIAELLERMAPRKKILLATINLCREPKAVSEVNDFIDKLQQTNFSVYSAATLCDLMEDAGALRRITEDGEDADSVDVEPKTVVIDGVEYLEPGDPIEVFWVSTEDGIAIADADKPLERLQELFQADETYLPIYKRILTLCAADSGATTPQINAVVDDDPLVQSPRLYAPHFIDKLEKCDALTWKKTWVITEIGQAGLDLLADVSDDTETATTEED